MDEKAAVRERWLAEMFARAAGDDLALLDERAAIELMRRLNSQITTGRIKQKLAVSGGFTGSIKQKRTVGEGSRAGHQTKTLIYMQDSRACIKMGASWLET